MYTYICDLTYVRLFYSGAVGTNRKPRPSWTMGFVLYRYYVVFHCVHHFTYHVHRFLLLGCCSRSSWLHVDLHLHRHQFTHLFLFIFCFAELAWRISFKVCRTHCSCLQWGVQGFSFFRIGTSFDFRSATVGACIFSFCSWASKIWLQSKLYWICHFWFSFWSTWLILEFIGI